MALISHLRRIKLAYEKRTQSIHALKFGLNGPIVVNGKKFNNAMSAMGLSNQEVADVMNYIMNSWSNKVKNSYYG
jgi:mono/diheme cytochrome c family protein